MLERFLKYSITEKAELDNIEKIFNRWVYIIGKYVKIKDRYVINDNGQIGAEHGQ